MTLRIIVFSLCFLLPNAAFGKPSESAEAAAREYLDTLQRDGLSAMPEMIHPGEIGRIKEALLPLFQYAEDMGEWDETAEVLGIEMSFAEFETLSSKDFLRIILDFGEAQAAQFGGFDFDTYEIIGSVDEPPDVHVLTRLSVRMGALSATQVDVISLRPHEDTWWMLPTAEMEGLLAMLQAGFDPVQSSVMTSPQDFGEMDEVVIPPPPTGVGDDTFRELTEGMDFVAFDEPPQVVEQFTPIYPTSSQAALEEGSVFVRVAIDTEGRVIAAIVERSEASPALENAAIRAAKKWRFTPAKQAGTPVACQIVMPFEFSLE